MMLTRTEPIVNVEAKTLERVKPFIWLMLGVETEPVTTLVSRGWRPGG